MVIDLATHMDERFEAFELWVDRRFEEADQKVYRLFSEIDERIDKLETKIDLQHAQVMKLLKSLSK